MSRSFVRHPVSLITLAALLGLGVAALVLADTTSTLRPTADGGTDSGAFKNTGGSLCSGTDCYTEVDESSGTDCTNSDGDASYVEAKASGATITFDIDEASIPDDATITAIAIKVCHKYKKSAADNTFQTKGCIDGSCALSGADITAGDSYAETTQSHSGFSITKTSTTDVEIGIEITGTEIRLSQISAVITYTAASDTTAPAPVTNLATGTPTTTSMPLTWTAPGDDGSTGTATTYDVRYSTSNITAGNFSSATAATGEPTPSVAGSSETMTVSSLSVNTQYYFAMKTADEVPNTSGLSNVVSKYTLANAPTAAAFGSVTETSIAAKWTINGNPAGTEFYVENQTAVTNSGWIADNTAWTSSSLNASTEYSFRVKARNGGSIETAWVSLGSKSTSASSSDGDDSSTTTTTTATTPTLTPAVPQATGPTVAAPVVAPEPEAAAIGAPGTTTADTSAGETTTEVPILPTKSDTTPPTVTITEAPEVVDKTKITFTGEAIEEEAEFSGVIAGLAYSLDNGTSWHPVSSVEGLGTVKASFTVTTPVLPDGTYDIIVRARDNTKNEGFSKITQATIDLLPVIFGSAVLLQPSGDAFTTASPTTIAGSSIRLIAAFEGGVTEAKVKLANQNISLEPDNIKRRWGGIITLPEEGKYTIKLQARDGADNTFEQDIGTITVVPPLQTIDSKNNQPVAGANVTLEKFDENALIWRISRIPGQDNPQQASAEGSVSYLTDRGTFRLRVKAPGYWNGVSRSFTTNDPTPLSGTVQLPRRPWYMYLIPLRTRPLPLITQDLLAISPSTITDKNEQLNLLPRDLANAERTLDEFVGHRILITTVAAWNRSSQEQLAVLQRLQTKLGADVVIIPWLVQQPPSVLAGIITRGGYDLTGFADVTGQDSESLERTIFPSHFFFDREGTLRRSRTGFSTVDELVNILGEIQ